MKDVQLKIDFGGLSQNLTGFPIFFQVGNRRSARSLKSAEKRRVNNIQLYRSGHIMTAMIVV